MTDRFQWEADDIEILGIDDSDTPPPPGTAHIVSKTNEEIHLQFGFKHNGMLTDGKAVVKRGEIWHGWRFGELFMSDQFEISIPKLPDPEIEVIG